MIEENIQEEETMFSFNLTNEDIFSDAYKEGWNAWNLYADSRFRHKPQNPYNATDRDYYVWNRGWNANDYRLYDKDENETEEYHSQQFDETIIFELEKYYERTKVKYNSLAQFYYACQDGKVKAKDIEDLIELKDINERLAKEI